MNGKKTREKQKKPKTSKSNEGNNAKNQSLKERYNQELQMRLKANANLMDRDKTISNLKTQLYATQQSKKSQKTKYQKKETQFSDRIRHLEERNTVLKKKVTGSKFQRIDNGLGIYYALMARSDYYNGHAQGKFITFVKNNGLKEANIDKEIGNESKASQCSYIAMDGNFPLHSTLINKNQTQKQEIIFYIIKYCALHQKPPTLQQIKSSSDTIIPLLLSADSNNAELYDTYSSKYKIQESSPEPPLQCLDDNADESMSPFLDRLRIELGKYRTDTQLIGFFIFIWNNEYDTDAIIKDAGPRQGSNESEMIDVYEQSNIKYKMDIFDVLKDYIDDELLNRLKDPRFADLLKELASLRWKAYQIRSILYIFVHNHCDDQFDSMNQETLQKLCNMVTVLSMPCLPGTASKDLWLSIENINDPIHRDRFRDESNCIILSCNPLKRIIISLHKYQRNGIDDIIKDDANKAYKTLLNDYNHILISHLDCCSLQKDDNFQFIYDECRQFIKCEAIKCDKLKRNHDENGKYDGNDDHLTIYRNLLDTIHCYFIHSIDIGYRTNKTKEIIDEKEIDWVQSIFNDIVLKKNKNKQHKFTSTIFEHKGDDNTFSFGHKHYYWDKYQYNEEEESYFSPNYGYKMKDWYITQKYINIKEEILNNTICSLTVEQYNYTMLRSKAFARYCDRCKQTKCHTQIYGIDIGTVLQIDNILSVAFYTDFTLLSCHFSRTFRYSSDANTEKTLKERNAEFFHWSKTLRETVECYGTSFRDQKSSPIFYHGISTSQLSFKEYIAYFAGPTSTSVEKIVAERFATVSGMVLELEKNNEYGWDLTYFDVSWISFHGNEDERLFFGGSAPLSFRSIILIQSGT